MNGVVQVTREGSIARVAMEDRASKNTLSPSLTAGLLAAFDQIARDAQLRAVVLHGYDGYFCCGGTQEELLAIQEGRAVFTDTKVFDLLLRCELPVVAAMQGHALGGGLVLGCYADVLVMGAQCLYGANFMEYGFTPGFGSTFILPRRLGATLGAEMLFTARSYQGRELAARGAGPVFVDRSDVLPTAMRLAREIAEKPRLALVTLKRRLRAAIQAELDEHVRAELEMHRVTFPQPEVRRRIEALFRDR